MTNNLEPAMLEFLKEYHATRDYYECHEILEARWREDPPEARGLHFAALIQVAVGMYHYRRANTNGAVKLFKAALDKITRCGEAMRHVGVDVEALVRLLNQSLAGIEQDLPYRSSSLPLQPYALNSYVAYCKENKIEPFKESDLNDEYLLHRHLKKGRDSHEA